jgi:aryl-phospho-beta-D-glucosidase BglC (GH1 family)
MKKLISALLLVCTLLQGADAHPGRGAPIAGSPPPPSGFGLKVVGSTLVSTADGVTVVQPRGVNVSGLEGNPFSSDPWSGNDPNFTGMATTWKANIVRIPIAEGNWLVGGGGTYPLCNPGNYYTAAQFQATVASAVASANAAGIYVILDLHRAAVPNLCSTGQAPMADTAYSPTFWTQVATIYKNNPGVLFELYNEPVAPNTPPISANWTAYLSGMLMESTDTNVNTMLAAIRGTGATNVIIMDGLDYACCANSYQLPTDTLSPAQIVMAKHEYYGTTYDAGWNTAHGNGVPILITEFGDTGTSTSNTTAAFAWADPLGIGYVAWAYDYSAGWGGAGNYQLISTQAGAVYSSNYAAAVNAHFLCRANNTC